MNKITKIETQNIIQNVEVTKYVTIDGREFDSEKLALFHEENIINRNKIKEKYRIEDISLSSEKNSYIFYTESTTLQDKIEIAKFFGCYRNDVHLSSPGWYMFQFDDDVDYTYYYCYTINFYKEIIESEIRNLNKDIELLNNYL